MFFSTYLTNPCGKNWGYHQHIGSGDFDRFEKPGHPWRIHGAMMGSMAHHFLAAPWYNGSVMANGIVNHIPSHSSDVANWPNQVRRTCFFSRPWATQDSQRILMVCISMSKIESLFWVALTNHACLIGETIHVWWKKSSIFEGQPSHFPFVYGPFCDLWSFTKEKCPEMVIHGHLWTILWNVEVVDWPWKMK